MKILIFTDLDGTLLNHNDYSCEEAKEALQKISDENIPLIFTTSKTRSEVEMLQKKLNIKEPFIIENGAALFIPKDYQNMNLDFLDDFGQYKTLILGKPYKQVLQFYAQYKDEFGMRGFSDMGTEEVIKYTQLSKQNAELSKQRDFTEPFILKDPSKLEKLKNLAFAYNIKITKGGRFYHLIGEKQDKGIAVKKTIELFEKLLNEKIRSIALGDGQNDIPMLENVDIPIVIKNHAGEYTQTDIKNIQYSTHQGSLGFNEMVLKNV
jgi:mannosyl-3-phosphoglycerate phosphatase